MSRKLVPVFLLLTFLISLGIPAFAYSRNSIDKVDKQKGFTSIKGTYISHPKVFDTLFNTAQGKQSSAKIDASRDARQDIARVYTRNAVEQPEPVSKSSQAQKKAVQASTQASLPSGKHIVVNKTKFTLTLYDKKSAVKTYRVAIGKPGHSTPEGRFYITNKAVNPSYGGRNAPPAAGGAPDNPLGVRWMGLSWGTQNLYGIHGTNDPDSIGTAASFGCVRLSNQDVSELYVMVPSGTPVWIGSEALLTSWGINKIAKSLASGGKLFLIDY